MARAADANGRRPVARSRVRIERVEGGFEALLLHLAERAPERRLAFGIALACDLLGEQEGEVRIEAARREQLGQRIEALDVGAVKALNPAPGFDGTWKIVLLVRADPRDFHAVGARLLRVGLGERGA